MAEVEKSSAGEKLIDALKRKSEEKGVSLDEVVEGIVSKRGEKQEEEHKEAIELGTVSRTAIRANFSSTDKTELESDEHEVVKRLADLVCSFHAPDPLRDLSQDEVETLAEELLTIRDVQNILEGRHNAIKKIVFAGLTDKNYDAVDPEFEPDEYISYDFGKRIKRSISGGKPLANWEELENVLPEALWNKVTNKVVTVRKVYGRNDKLQHQEKTETREIDEDRLLEAYQNGEVTLEHLEKITTTTKKQARFIISNYTPE